MPRSEHEKRDGSHNAPARVLLQFERTFRGGARMSVIGVNSHDAVFDKSTVLIARTDRVQRKVCGEVTKEPALAMPSNGLLPDDQTTDTGN